MKVISIPRSEDEYREYTDNGYDDRGITAIFKNRVDDIVSEFKMMSQFKGTSNIVSYEDHMIVPHSDGCGWDILIRMELLTPLPEYIRQNGLTEGQAIQMGSDICRALELCGQRGIIHRDIKPQNIFVNEFGDFKLGDFGIARTMDHTTKATKTGTYSYMAPEVYSDKPYGASVDTYSLGLVLYWVLNERRLPFLPLPPAVPTAAQNNEAQMKRLGGETITEPKYGSSALKNAVLMACSFDPAQRFASPKLFRQALNVGGQEPNRIILSPTSQAGSQNINRPSREATDYNAGEWSMKFEPPRRREQSQSEFTKGAWDDSSSIHWESSGSSDNGTYDQPSTAWGEQGAHTTGKRNTSEEDALNARSRLKKSNHNPRARKALRICVGVVTALLLSSLGGVLGKEHATRYMNSLSDSSYSVEDSSITKDPYTKGELKDNIYRNDWAGLLFSLPEGFENASEDYYALFDSEDNLDCGLVLISDNNEQIAICFEQLVSSLITENIYLDSATRDGAKGIQSQGVSMMTDGKDRQRFFIGTEEYTKAHVDWSYGDSIQITESYYVHKIDDRMCVILIVGASGTDNDRLAQLLDGVRDPENGDNRITDDTAFTKGTFDGTTYVNEWANLKFVIPEGWEVEDDSDIDTDTIQHELYTHGYDAQSSFSCSVKIYTLEGEALSMTEEEYLDYMMKLMYGIESDRQYERIQLGYTFTSIHFITEYDYMVSLYACKLVNRMCIIEVLGESREQNEQFVSRFTSCD